MKFKMRCRFCFWGPLFGLAVSIGATAQTYTVIANLTGGNAYPQGNLIQGVNGNLYGTSYGYASSNEYGTVFEVTTSGTVSTLYKFCAKPNCADGSYPVAGLVLANDLNFYGTTTSGGAYGYGTVFKLTPSGALTTLYSFCQQTACADGATPHAGLVQGTSGLLYGTTESGGARGLGTVFSIATSGEAFTTLYSFCLGRCDGSGPNDGSAPESALVQDSSGNFYGTTSYGTIFEITPQGTLTTAYEFCSLPFCADGNDPSGNMALSPDGVLYGTTLAGGSGGSGIVWSLNTLNGSYVDLFNSILPNGVVFGTNGYIYGTTLGATGRSGVVYPTTAYKMSATGSLYTQLYTSCPENQCASEAPPLGELVEATNGIFYGTSTGTVFSLSDGLAPFVMSVPTFGNPGNKVRILGTNLTGSTAVSFDGKPATFMVNSSSEITAEVPTGAKTGQIIVQTPGGKLKSNVDFTIL
jgi:uncharacterized repeat protein (TIGR03803 family)